MAVPLEQYLAVAGDQVVARVHSEAPPAPFWQRLLGLAKWLELEHVPGPPELLVRTLLLGSRPHGGIEFVGAVAGRQLQPLVQTLRTLATHTADFDTPATPARLRELSKAVELVVAVSPSCPYCPRVAAQALSFACASSKVRVSIVRVDTGQVTPAVQSVPTVLANGQLVATGAIGEYALLERILALELRSSK